MLNVGAMTPIVLEEKIKLNEKGSYILANIPSAYGKMKFDLLRNAVDDTFNLEASSEITALRNQSFNVDNKSFEGSDIGVENIYKAHSSILGSAKLGTSKSISAMFSNVNSKDFSTLSIFPIITPIDKNIIMTPNSYLKIRTINRISLHMNVNTTSKIVDGSKSGLESEIFYTDTYVIPRDFDPISGNSSMFDIYVKNDNQEKIDGDVGYFPGELETSATGSSKMKLNTIPFEGDETFDNAKKVSTINIFDYSYYDYDKKKLEVGYGEDAQKGICIPYGFKGDFRRVFKISPNYIFKDLNVMLETNVTQPLLNPYDGKVILHIDDTQEDSHQWRIISSEDFERLEDTDPSLEGLKRISYEENI